MSSEPSTDASDGALRSRWQLAAAGLAAAAALVRLVAVVNSSWPATGLLPTDGRLDAAAETSYWAFLWEVAGGTAGNVAGLLAQVAPAVVLPVVVPAVGAWLAQRREPIRARLGLATVATWGGLFALAGMVSTVLAGSVPRLSSWLLAGTLGVAALAAALWALRVHPGSWRLETPTTRAVAAAAIAVWGMAGVAVAGLQRASVPEALAAAQPAWFDHLIRFQLPGLVAVLAVAVVVWRRDTLLAVPAAVVVAIQAVVSLIERWARPTSPADPRFEPTLPEIAGIPVDAAVEALGAAVVVAAAAGLVVAARAEWHNRRLGSVPAESSPH